MSFNKDSSEFSVSQYLQNAILQLCNDQVAYSETLHVLGVLCITADNEQSEIVIKINSTLKRLNSLTPPKENSPGFKSKSLLMLSPSVDEEHVDVDGHSINSDKTPSDDAQIISNYESGSLEMRKGRGRKQSNPAKVQSVEDVSVVDGEVVNMNCVNENQSSDSELVMNDDVKQSFNLVLPTSFNFSSVSGNNNNNNNRLTFKREHSINDDVNDSECLDLSNKSLKTIQEINKKNLESFKLSCPSNNIWNFPYSQLSSDIPNFNLPFLQMGLLRNNSLNEYIPQNINSSNNFNAFINQPNTPNQSTVSSYRKILPASTPLNTNNTDNSNVKQFQTFSNSNKHSFNDMIIDKFDTKTEEDYLLDCLNVNGKKRRRRSLEDALTLDEIHEYLGSRDQPMDDSYTCKVCGHTSPDLLKYFHHTLSIHKSFICHQCGRCFTTKSSLLRHRPIHTGLRRFACSICQKAFYRKDKCKAHIKKHAEVQGDSEASNNVQVL